MILNWKGDGALVVSPIDVDLYEEANKIEDRVEREGAIRNLITPIKQVAIIPGWNDVDDAIWFKCRKHVDALIDSGKIEEMSKEVKDSEGNTSYVGMTISDFKTQNKVNGISKLSEIIKGCHSLETLKKWKSMDAREDIRKEIMDKMDLLNAPPENT
jgi:hypothetical protein